MHEFVVKGFTQEPFKGFRGRIDRTGWEPEEGGNTACDDYSTPGRASLELWEQSLHEEHNVRAVQDHDIFKKFVRLLPKPTSVGDTCIQSEVADVDVCEVVRHKLVILRHRLHLAEVCNHTFGLDLRIELLEFGKLVIDLRCVARDDADIESLVSQLMADFQTDAIRATSDNSIRLLARRSVLLQQILIFPAEPLENKEREHNGIVSQEHHACDSKYFHYFHNY